MYKFQCSYQQSFEIIGHDYVLKGINYQRILYLNMNTICQKLQQPLLQAIFRQILTMLTITKFRLLQN